MNIDEALDLAVDIKDNPRCRPHDKVEAALILLASEHKKLRENFLRYATGRGASAEMSAARWAIDPQSGLATKGPYEAVLVPVEMTDAMYGAWPEWPRENMREVWRRLIAVVLAAQRSS